jgi:hypothetical protein
MPHDKAHFLLCRPPSPVFDLHLPHDAWPMPASGRFQRGPPRLLHPQGQRRLLLPPRCECLAHATGARAQRHYANPLLQTQAEGTTTRGLPLRHHPAHPLTAQRQTCLNRDGGFDTITAVAITQAAAEGQTTSPAHPQTQEYLFAVVATILARPISRVGGLWTLRLVLIRAIQGYRRGILMSPWGRDRRDLQRLECDSAKPAVQICRKQRLTDGPSAVSME